MTPTSFSRLKGLSDAKEGSLKAHFVVCVLAPSISFSGCRCE
ncbi:hypothetical protein AC062_0931 [Pasteurellaceae bacterium NI1060]|nr:hypothetical protein AC062_0931 [Pasteurellaceae bacterium NI1060]